MKSSYGLKQILLRHGYNPSGDGMKDIKTLEGIEFISPSIMESFYKELDRIAGKTTKTK